jgi:hypothetical protein
VPYTSKQRRYIYAQASKGVAWAKKEVASGKAEHLHKRKRRVK